MFNEADSVITGSAFFCLCVPILDFNNLLKGII